MQASCFSQAVTFKACFTFKAPQKEGENVWHGKTVTPIKIVVEFIFISCRSTIESLELAREYLHNLQTKLLRVGHKNIEYHVFGQ